MNFKKSKGLKLIRRSFMELSDSNKGRNDKKYASEFYKKVKIKNPGMRIIEKT